MYVQLQGLDGRAQVILGIKRNASAAMFLTRSWHSWLNIICGYATVTAPSSHCPCQTVSLHGPWLHHITGGASIGTHTITCKVWDGVHGAEMAPCRPWRVPHDVEPRGWRHCRHHCQCQQGGGRECHRPESSAVLKFEGKKLGESWGKVGKSSHAPAESWSEIPAACVPVHQGKCARCRGTCSKCMTWETSTTTTIKKKSK
jgi:hypothetical protein